MSALTQSKDSPLLPRIMQVRAYQKETEDVFSLTLDPGSPTTYQPGQFNMLYTFGVGEAAISISGDSSDHTSIVHTIRAVGSVTKSLSHLRPGAAVGVRGPFGSTWPLEAAHGRDVVIVSGGIGLAPLRPVLYHVMRHRADFGKIVLLHGSRTPADILFADELSRWARVSDLSVLQSCDQGGDGWRGHVGVVTTLLPLAEFDHTNALAFICGPEVMMRFVVRELQMKGMAVDQMYLSLERNMQCAVGFCGHCQFGPNFVCMDGPVFRYDRIQSIFDIREI